MPFVYPGSYAAIQHNLFLIIQALNRKMIDNRTANTYKRLFRACELNLTQAEDAGMSIKLAEKTQDPEDRSENPLPSMSSEANNTIFQSPSSHQQPEQSSPDQLSSNAATEISVPSVVNQNPHPSPQSETSLPSMNSALHNFIPPAKPEDDFRAGMAVLQAARDEWIMQRTEQGLPVPQIS